MSFHTCAKSFLLTYAHAEGQDGRDPLDPFAIVGVLGELGGECIVAKELYPTSDGFHFHVFVMFERRFRSRKTDVFDVGGFHPNIEPSRKNAVGGFDYATKDGDIVAGGLERPSGESGRRSADRTADAWGQITAAGSLEEFWSLLEELDPKSMVCSFNAVSKFCDWKFRAQPVPYRGPDGVFDVAEYPDIGVWRDTFLPRGGGGRRKSLILFGPTRMGKTTWARSLGSHMYFGGLFSAREALDHPEAEYAVIDDIAGGIKFFPRYKDWLGCQAEFQLKELYREPRLFKWGRPAIWCSNEDPRCGLGEPEVDWLEGNCIFVRVSTPIFHASTE
ncbi:replication-associated protein [Blackfly genomovirus 5]|uniref:Replication-associated protein n=1 Tax=Blackfly genomovirus 5 TaxID=2586204 RepID=A0A4Y5QKX2_9VIRU|nr:replication-associated protein [Blackfly genomovirus 5]QCX35065.1 replication-associated protein [Blackfly genomovirus 5]